MKAISFFCLWAVFSLLTAFLFFSGAAAAATVTIDKNDQSVLVVTDTNAIKIQPWSSGTIRVEAAPGKTIPDKKSFAVVSAPDAKGWSTTEDADKVELKGERLSASVNKQTGFVSFFGPGGAPLLQQTAWDFKPAQDPARDGLDVATSFQRSPGEHFYGGGVIGDDLRKPTSEIDFSNNNTRIRIPVLYSSRGYGLFWDNPGRGKLKLTADTVTWDYSSGDLADFYAFAGPTADAAVSEYRKLTGVAPLFPKWAYGFWFSKNKFNSQQEILDAAKAFRDHQFPVDMLVQDYYYWQPAHSTDTAGWGSHHFVEERYPDAKQMVDQLHQDYHIHFMAVIWPRLNDDTDHAKELDAAQMLFPHAGTSGWNATTRFYDPFSPKGREIYGRQVMESLLPIGLDAFWMDGAEPELDNNTVAKFDSVTGPVSRMMSAYPLMHTTAVYAAHRAATSDKRVVLLPRSSWAGEQRNGASNWTGDISQNWNAFNWQIEGLQNYSIAGLPYITTDVGGYEPTTEADRELFVRWFEWGTFCPIDRVHGVGRPFPWQYGTEAEAILKKFTLLRYRLLPYIYTQAASITQENGSLMRPLVMDFQDDPKALDTWDEFLFGPSILVCPVRQSILQPAATLDQWADMAGTPKGVTATFLKNGNETGVRKDLGNAFDLNSKFTDDEKAAKTIRIEGTFTPKEDGKLALMVTAINSPNVQCTATINGQSVNPNGPTGDWQYPLFPFAAKAGTPVHLSIECDTKRPGLRIVRMPAGPLHRDVYLPGKGDWYDFWTGEKTPGGQNLSPETPLDRIPLYVRAGSILPMGPELQYVAEKPANPIELRVYRGADGAFTLYEDEGDNYNYEKNAFAKIPITWNEQAKTLTIGARQGQFPGMLASRTFRIVWVSENHGAGSAPVDQADKEVTYTGAQIIVPGN